MGVEAALLPNDPMLSRAILISISRPMFYFIMHMTNKKTNESRSEKKFFVSVFQENGYSARFHVCMVGAHEMPDFFAAFLGNTVIPRGK